MLPKQEGRDHSNDQNLESKESTRRADFHCKEGHGIKLNETHNRNRVDYAGRKSRGGLRRVPLFQNT